MKETGQWVYSHTHFLCIDPRTFVRLHFKKKVNVDHQNSTPLIFIITSHAVFYRDFSVNPFQYLQIVKYFTAKTDVKISNYDARLKVGVIFF